MLPGARTITVAAVTVVALLPAACGSGSEERRGGDGAASPAAADVAFGESLAQIKGHHRVSLELYRAGDRPGAVTHASHPIDEIVSSIASELAEAGPDVATELTDALERGRSLVRSGAPAPEVAAAYDDAAAVADDALAAVVAEHDSASYVGSVVAALLGTAAHEYDEAVTPSGRVSLIVEYQDGYAFVREAESLYETIADDVTAAEPTDAASVRDAFDRLEDALAGPTPPRRPAPADDIASAARLIGHELEETVAAELLADTDPEAIVGNINALLDKVVTSYTGGDAETAGELAAEAYLDNYEVIEAQVIERAPEINDELEPLLGAELRREIRSGASPQEIRDLVERARVLLDGALEAIEGHES